MQTRDRVHQLVDELPDSEMPKVERFLTRRRHAAGALPLVLANAAEDGEPPTEEEEAAVAAAYADIAAGRIVPHDEARRRLLGQP